MDNIFVDIAFIPNWRLGAMNSLIGVGELWEANFLRAGMALGPEIKEFKLVCVKVAIPLGFGPDGPT